MGQNSKRGKERGKGGVLEQTRTQLTPQGSDIKDPLTCRITLDPGVETEAGKNHHVAIKPIGKDSLRSRPWPRYSIVYCSSSP